MQHVAVFLVLGQIQGGFVSLVHDLNQFRLCDIFDNFEFDFQGSQNFCDRICASSREGIDMFVAFLIHVGEVHRIFQDKVAQAVRNEGQSFDASVFFNDLRFDRQASAAAAFVIDHMIKFILERDPFAQIRVRGQIRQHVHRFRKGNGHAEFAFMDFLFSVEKGHVKSGVPG